MRATSLRTCLNSLGANFINEIEYIETEYGNEDYLNKVCKAVDEFLVYDKLSTESQPDSCTSGRTAYMYPSHCTHGWLGPNCTNICFSDCLNSCGKANYDGFYCKGIYNIWYKNYKHIKQTCHRYVETIKTAPSPCETTPNHGKPCQKVLVTHL